MPRIKADSVAEHVEQQRVAVLNAAIELFVERGYAEVGLADIAARVGLARNSLYRYVPDKSALLVEWYRRAIPETIGAWRAATAGDDPPAERLQRWAHAYLTWALSPQHRLVGPLTDLVGSLDDETRREVGELHRQMMGVVAEVVEDAGVAPDEVGGVVDLLAGLVLGAARAEQGGSVDERVRRRLDAGVAAVLTAA